MFNVEKEDIAYNHWRLKIFSAQVSLSQQLRALVSPYDDMNVSYISEPHKLNESYLNPKVRAPFKPQN